MTRENTVWIAPGATSFSCLCERCLDERGDATSFLAAIRVAAVRGELAPEAELAIARCNAGHRVVVRRIDRPPRLARPHARQLELG
jgi:hypothetical protein